MFNLNLNQPNYRSVIKSLIKKWDDRSNLRRPLIIVKTSEAFTMYHQTVPDDWTLENQEFKGLHPVLINNLETGFNVILTLDTAGRLQHCYLILDNGDLKKNDSLLRFAHKNRHQEYLDYFYCINKNIHRYLDDNAGSIKK